MIPIDALLFACLSLSLLYLIYRYHRYSTWWQTEAGRAFMTMKVCLFMLSTYRLSDVWFLEGFVEDVIRAGVLSAIIGAVNYQTYVVIDSQGGFRRSSRREAVIEEEPHQPMT